MGAREANTHKGNQELVARRLHGIKEVGTRPPNYGTAEVLKPGGPFSQILKSSKATLSSATPSFFNIARVAFSIGGGPQR